MVTPFPRTPGDAPTSAVPTGAGPDRGRGAPAPWPVGRHAPSPGDRLGAYRLDRVVGEGGMGVVYLGLDDEHRVAALKVLKPHIAADPHARQRLAREVATLERVRHPRVAEVLSADVDGPWPHLVTRYVPGPPLDAVVESRGPLTGSRLRDLGHGLADALHAIHAAGVVHRDLKPSNVLVLDGLPVVIDFGIAHVADDVRLTSTGLVMGTPGYLSPEVVAGGTVSDATDWWGWAATVAYAASGRAPFGTGPMEVVLDRVRRADVDLSAVPPALRGPLLSALAVDPAHRPHPDALLRALDGATTGPVQLTPTPPTWTPPAPSAPSAPPPAAGGSRFAALVGPETTALPPVPPVAPPPADSTTVLPPVAPATTPVPVPPGRGPRTGPAAPGAMQAPAGWIPGAPGPGPAQRPAPQGPPPGYPPAPGQPQGQPQGQPMGRPLGTNGQPARPQRSWTLFAVFLALLAVLAVAPATGVVLALLVATLARTVDRASAGLFRRRWEAGPRSSDKWAVGAATPWHAVRAALASVLHAVLPLVVAASTVVVLGLLSGVPALAAGGPLSLVLGGAAGLLTAWAGPGSRSLQRGARSVVRTALRTERATGVALGLLLLVVFAGAVLVSGGTQPDWAPLQGSPFAWL